MLDPVLALFRRAGNLALPPRCAGCGAIVGEPHRFCQHCWGSLDLLGPPWCAGCNRPFAYDRGAEARCADCLTRPPRHAGVRAAVGYGAVARTLALRLKYGGRTGDAVTAARLMARHLPPDADLLVPVPLHRTRLWSRGYNQAALIATALAAQQGIAVERSALRRVRATPVLRGLGAAQRRRAVRGAFTVDEGVAVRLARRAIVLVDDVYTSGATADACTAALLGAGAGRVTVLAWARVLHDRHARN